MQSEAQVRFRHGHHAPPEGTEIGAMHGEVREAIIDCELGVESIVDEALEAVGAEHSEAHRALTLFRTKMDEARMWANAAIAYAGACGKPEAGDETQPPPEEGMPPPEGPE